MERGEVSDGEGLARRSLPSVTITITIHHLHRPSAKACLPLAPGLVQGVSLARAGDCQLKALQRSPELQEMRE